MTLNLNSLVVVDGFQGQGVVYDYSQNPPPSVQVVIKPATPPLIFFYDNENASVALSNTTTALTNNNGNFHFLTAIPMQAPTGSGGTYSLVVGKDLASNGQTVVNCANLNLSFSNGGNPTQPISATTVNRNCSAIPNNSSYVFQPFQISGLGNFNTVTISVPPGQNIQKDVLIFVYGDGANLTSPLIGIIDNNGDRIICNTTQGNIYLVAFIQPSPSQGSGNTVVNFATGDPENDSKITFDDDELEVGAGADIKTDETTGSNNKGCLGFLGLW